MKKILTNNIPTSIKFLIVVVFILLGQHVQGQTESTSDTLETSAQDKFALIVAYFGETITHPGLNVGLECRLWARKKTKVLGNINLGGYTHPRHHKALFLDAEIGLRSTTKFGLYSDFFIGTGYNHSWVNGDTYAYNDLNEIEKIGNNGYSRLMSSTSFGLGWDFSQRDVLPMNVFIRLKPMFVYPVNHNLLIQGAVMTGIIWKL